MPNSTLGAETLQNSPKGEQERLCGNRVKSLKPRANALDLSTVQAVNMLSSTSWAHLNTMLRGVERCWVKFETGQTFRSTRLNISFVSRSFMCGSTKSSAFAQQRSTCWAHGRAVPSISKNCHGSFASFPCSLQCPRSFHYVVVASFTASTLNPRSCFTTSFFLPFCPHQWVRLLEVQPTIFTFWGDEYTSDSQPWFNMSLCEIFGMLNIKTSKTWCRVIFEVIWTPRSTTPLQTLNMLRACTLDKSSAIARGFSSKRCTLGL